MERFLIKRLGEWKNRSNKKPLLLQGARQVGKTYLLKEFGSAFYYDLAYFDFEKSPDLKDIFSRDLSPHSLVEKLGLYREKKIDAENTLIILDEIQACPRAISSLKYFCDEGKEYDVVAAGSLLGVKVGKETGFPVGKVNFMHLYPMNFMEYMSACELDLLAEFIHGKNSFKPLDEANHNKLTEHYKKYIALGGMPEVLSTYLESQDFVQAREIQKEIIMSYERDFSKYANESEAIKISKVWNSLPVQLARENKKFKYIDVEKGGRASAFELAIEWLKNAGLIHIAYCASKPLLPLNAYFQKEKFKIFMLDTGLLGSMLNISQKLIVSKKELFSQYNGAFVENYVANELIYNKEKQLSYWTSKSDAEVDFLIQFENSIIPLEVKSGLSKNTKSLRSYQDKFKPRFISRTSPRNYYQDREFVNIPLYAVSEIFRMLDS